MIEVKHVERYTIPIVRGMGVNEGTKVYDVYKALAKLPNGGVVTVDYDAIFVTYQNPPIQIDTD